MATHNIKYAQAGKAKVFYREAGPSNGPVILLLHGFPSSSFQYRNLIPILSAKYRVIAPDLPGFGFTEVPADYKYTFANLANTIAEFVDALNVKKFAVYIFDYGAPTGLRLALQRPEAITSIISQNGNSYEEGLGDFWNPLKEWWKTGNPEIAKALVPTLDAIKSAYTAGAPDAEALDPVTWTLDWALISRPGNAENVQLALFKDYKTNVEMYPKFHEYFRTTKVPTLAVWGKDDPIFTPPGAEAFKRDNPNAIVKLVNGGHFPLEHNLEEIGQHVLDFLETVSH
jgi:pimeloyl-ACP methyl ester carboxylesterase